ncbi:hypothetical protein P4133_25415 [Pseudomonas aeruginosa]|nr:hypothetical protein [Pseudomonas aeruginosa]
MDKLEIEYALAKQVPDMARGFTIATSYGELHVGAVDAPVVMKVVRDLLESELERAKVHERQEGRPGATKHHAIPAPARRIDLRRDHAHGPWHARPRVRRTK